MCFQILFDTGLLRIPKTIHVSDALLSSTVFPSLLSLLDCLYIIFFSFPPSFPFLYLFVSYFSTSSPLLFIFVALFPSSVLPFLFSSIFFSSCYLSFILLSLTNIPSISCSAPVIPRLLNPCPSSADNPFPPM